MTQKVAVAIIHGIGVPDPHFAEGMISELEERLTSRLQGQAVNAKAEFVFEPVLWAPVIQDEENALWSRLKEGNPLGFATLRRFIVDFAADALAYQPTPHDRGVYDGIHKVVAQSFKRLGQQAGPTAPLCIIAHSLGTVVASNYIYDLQVYPKKKLISALVRRAMGKTPLDKGQTLAGFYTLGSPLALWTLRYDDFGMPIVVPSPQLRSLHPDISGEWVNYYDNSDIIGYPLKAINDIYNARVTADKPVNVGNILTSWNPASHVAYWTDNDITNPLADSLAAIWRQANGIKVP